MMADLVIPVLGIEAAEAALDYIIRCHLKKTKTKNTKNSHIPLIICFVLFESRAHVT